MRNAALGGRRRISAKRLSFRGWRNELNRRHGYESLCLRVPETAQHEFATVAGVAWAEMWATTRSDLGRIVALRSAPFGLLHAAGWVAREPGD